LPDEEFNSNIEAFIDSKVGNDHVIQRSFVRNFLSLQVYANFQTPRETSSEEVQETLLESSQNFFDLSGFIESPILTNSII
jgi:hypothetical protein